MDLRMPQHHWTQLWRLLAIFQHFIYIFIGAAIVAFRHYWQKIQENRAAGWPSADGVVQSATIKQHNGSWVEASYRYYALQEYRYGKYRRYFFKKAAAKEFAANIKGRSLQVRYREDSPNVSVLMERDLEMTGALQLN
jgi:hypothetical protein